MERQGLNKSQLAKRAGIDPTFLGRIMSGERNPGVDTIVALSRALRIPVDTLISWTGIIRSDNPETDRDLEELIIHYKEMPAGQRRELVEFARFKNGTFYPDTALYTIFDELSRQGPDGPLMIVRHPDEIGTWLDTTAFDVITRAFVDGQGFVVEIVPKDRD